MESYLKSQDLWGVVCWPEGNEELDHEAFKMMNAIALHAIQVSCSPDILAKIIKKESANQAWKKLSLEYNPGLSLLICLSLIVIKFCLLIL